MIARALVVLLLILNLGVALWWASRGDAPVAAPRPLPPGAQPLSLPGEATPAAAAPASVPAPAQEGEPATPDAMPVDSATQPTDPVASAATECRTFGPFADVAARDRARTILAPGVQRVAPREVRTAARGWDVRMPAQANREAASAMAARLAAAGFNDHYIMPAATDGTMEIALGRFSSEDAAQGHQARLRAAGFEAVASPIGDDVGVRYWIDVEGPAGFDVVGLRRASGASQVERIDCAALAGAR